MSASELVLEFNQAILYGSPITAVYKLTQLFLYYSYSYFITPSTQYKRITVLTCKTTEIVTKPSCREYYDYISLLMDPMLEWEAHEDWNHVLNCTTSVLK